MAGTSGTVEYLVESLLHYGSKEPPFIVSGRRGALSVRINQTEEIQPIKYVKYAGSAGKRSFATIEINQRRYIIKALPKNWKRRDPIQHHGGCKYWFVWQGWKDEFVGEDFPGPVATSISKARPDPSPGLSDSKVLRPRRDRDRDRDRSSDHQSELETSSSSLPSGSADSDYAPSHVSRESTTAPSEGQTMNLGGPEIIDLTILSSESEERQLEELPALVPENQSAGLMSLSRGEEEEVVLRTRLAENMEHYTPVFFRDARPTDDPSIPVTMESFFDLIDRTLMPRKGRIHRLKANFWQRHHRIRTPYNRREGEGVQPLMFTRGNMCSWEAFMSYLREYMDGHMEVAWHISIDASCV